jgi:hypothetical protein
MPEDLFLFVWIEFSRFKTPEQKIIKLSQEPATQNLSLNFDVDKDWDGIQRWLLLLNTSQPSSLHPSNFSSKFRLKFWWRDNSWDNF